MVQKCAPIVEKCYYISLSINDFWPSWVVSPSPWDEGSELQVSGKKMTWKIFESEGDANEECRMCQSCVIPVAHLFHLQYACFGISDRYLFVFSYWNVSRSELCC
jgi:hypothetical protein